MAEISKRIAATALRVLPRKGLSRALGAVTRVGAPKSGVERAIDVFVRAYDVTAPITSVHGGSPARISSGVSVTPGS